MAILYLARDNPGHLYVLEERAPDEPGKRFKLSIHESGARKLNDRMSEYFRFQVDSGLETLNSIYNDIIANVGLSNVSVGSAKEEETQQFLDDFIEREFLTADLNLPWKEYIELKKDGKDGTHNLEHRTNTGRLTVKIIEDPTLFEFRRPVQEFYKEVELCSRLPKNSWRSLDDVFAYIRGEIKKSALEKQLIYPPDLIAYHPDHSYIIEIKSRINKDKTIDQVKSDGTSKKGKIKARTQLTRAGAFIYNNFDVPFTLVRIHVYKVKDDKMFVGYSFFNYDASKRGLVRIKKTEPKYMETARP